MTDIYIGACSGQLLYEILYNDGDREHMTEQQVRDFVKNDQQAIKHIFEKPILRTVKHGTGSSTAPPPRV